jgi:hypothetical protein
MRGAQDMPCPAAGESPIETLLSLLHFQMELWILLRSLARMAGAKDPDPVDERRGKASVAADGDEWNWGPWGRGIGGRLIAFACKFGAKPVDAYAATPPQNRPKVPQNPSLTLLSIFDGKFYGILFSYLVNFMVLLTN